MFGAISNVQGRMWDKGPKATFDLVLSVPTGDGEEVKVKVEGMRLVERLTGLVVYWPAKYRGELDGRAVFFEPVRLVNYKEDQSHLDEMAVAVMDALDEAGS